MALAPPVAHPPAKEESRAKESEDTAANRESVGRVSMLAVINPYMYGLLERY